MTIADTLQPVTEALKSLRHKVNLPTPLSSDEIRQLDAAVRRQSLFSARTTLDSLLEEYRSKLDSLIHPTTENRPDRVTPDNPTGATTVGLNPASARAEIKDFFRSIGIEPSGEAGSVRDLASDARINLVLKTNTELAQGAGFAVASNHPAVLEAFPAWELYRLEDKKEPRDWPQRWRLCASVVGDVHAARVLEETGRMVALKDSEIWQALGDGEDGSLDTLGNPYPPFAFHSGMWTKDVDYDDAERLGLVDLNTRVESNLPADLSDLFATEA